MSLAKRSVSSVAWNTIASFSRIPIGIIQTIILARYLPIEYFGIYAGMAAIVSLSAVFFGFGLRSAFLHRSPETADEQQAAAILFTLRVILSTTWLLLLLIFGIVFLKGLHQYVFLVLVFTGYLTKVIDIPRSLFIRRVKHRRLAIMDFVISSLAALVSILIAVFYASIWALLISSVITIIVMLVFFYIWKPIWKPSFVWDKEGMKYFIRFGWHTNIANILGHALDQIDDLWASFYLGDLLLGYYSRAYKFATYPRVFLSFPVNTVALGVYAELKNDRLRLSQAFFRFTAFLIRSGFLLAGWLLLVAPYVIRIFLGDRWMPMLDAFRLMLVFTMLDPIKVTIAGVLVAVGEPDKVTKARLVQLMVLLPALYLLGGQFGISGVAVAVNIMMLIGIGLFLYFIKDYVDYSLRRLFLVPTAALAVALGISLFVDMRFEALSADWMRLIFDSVLYSLIYLVILFSLEGRTLIDTLIEVIRISNLEKFQKYIPGLNYFQHLK